MARLFGFSKSTMHTMLRVVLGVHFLLTPPAAISQTPLQPQPRNVAVLDKATYADFVQKMAYAYDNGPRYAGKDSRYLCLNNFVLWQWEVGWYKDFEQGQKWWEDPDVAADPYSWFAGMRDQLNKAGVEFLCVYLPPKTSVYPELVSEEIRSLFVQNYDGAPAFPAHSQEEFIENLKNQHNIDIINLQKIFLANRGRMTDKSAPAWEEHFLWTRGDPHPSPNAFYIAAQVIKKHIENRPWFKNYPHKDLTVTTWEERNFRGVLTVAESYDETSPLYVEHTMPVPKVTFKNGVDVAAETINSPILVTGSSPTHWWGDGHNFHYQLQGAFGFPIPRISENGNFLDRANDLKEAFAQNRSLFENKKLIILIVYSNNLRTPMTGLSGKLNNLWNVPDMGFDLTGSIGPLNIPDNYAPWDSFSNNVTVGKPLVPSMHRMQAGCAGLFKFDALGRIRLPCATDAAFGAPYNQSSCILFNKEGNSIAVK
jgi:hypothetical protein